MKYTNNSLTFKTSISPKYTTILELTNKLPKEIESVIITDNIDYLTLSIRFFEVEKSIRVDNTLLTNIIESLVQLLNKASREQIKYTRTNLIPDSNTTKMFVYDSQRNNDLFISDIDKVRIYRNNKGNKWTIRVFRNGALQSKLYSSTCDSMKHAKELVERYLLVE
jgi:hypothetical protein